MPLLLQAAADYLERELLPTLEGYHRFHSRVCVNTLRIVQRQIEQGAALEDAEVGRLRQLLESDGSAASLNEKLMDRLESGSLSLEADGLVDHLKATLFDALRINSPGWVAET
jgi:hypothetical protein